MRGVIPVAWLCADTSTAGAAHESAQRAPLCIGGNANGRR
jgi:hypothetical protein